MKNFNVLVSLLLFSCFAIFSCSVDESVDENVSSELNLKGKERKELIGEINNGRAKITADKSIILKKWNKRLAQLNRSLKTELLELVIKKNVDKDFILVASGDEYSSSRILLLEGNYIYLFSDGVTLTCETVSCAADSGCEAKMTGNCSPCSGDCKKTTTISQ